MDTWQTALALMVLVMMIISVMGIIETTRQDLKLRQKEYDKRYFEDIEEAYYDGRQDEEDNFKLNYVLIPNYPNRKRSEGRTDWIELPDEGACLQALPEPQKGVNNEK